MKPAVSAAVFSLCLLLAPLTAGAQHGAGVETYARAVEAIKRNDCVVAVRELEAYKKEAASELSNNQKFAAQVEEQITRCREWESQRGRIYIGNVPAGGNPLASTPGTAGPAAGWGSHRGGVAADRPVGRSIELRTGY